MAAIRVGCGDGVRELSAGDTVRLKAAGVLAKASVSS